MDHSLTRNLEGAQIDLLTIRLDKNISEQHRDEIERLCIEGIKLYLGDSWYGNPYQISSQIGHDAKKYSFIWPRDDLLLRIAVISAVVSFGYFVYQLLRR